MGTQKSKIVLPTLLSKLFFIGGAALIVVSTFFMATHLHESDNFFYKWLVLVVGGLAFVLLGLVFGNKKI